MKQTAVEWLFNQMSNVAAGYVTELNEQEILDKAIAMEKEQAILFLEEYDSYVFRGGSASAEEYYNETFIESE